MQQLTKRLSTVDPEAAEELKVVTYFDGLVAEHASAEALVRGATALARVAVGFETPRVTMRIGTDGRRTTPPAGSGAQWSGVALGVSGRVWLERDGDPARIDWMIVTRLAMALSLTLSHTGRDSSPLELLIEPETPPAEQVEAARRLRLTSSSFGRMVATTVGPAAPPGSIVVASSVGFVAASYVPDGSAIATGGVAGVGISVRGLALAISWQTAVLALRLSNGETVVADDLGVLLPFLLASEREAADHPDVRVLSHIAEVDPGMLATAKALGSERSVRAAATLLGLHPSTVQARTVALTDALGFDPLSADGRVRLALALRLHKLAETRLAPSF